MVQIVNGYTPYIPSKTQLHAISIIRFSDDTAVKVDTFRTDVVYEPGIRYKVGDGELYLH